MKKKGVIPNHIVVIGDMEDVGDVAIECRITSDGWGHADDTQLFLPVEVVPLLDGDVAAEDLPAELVLHQVERQRRQRVERLLQQEVDVDVCRKLLVVSRCIVIA